MRHRKIAEFIIIAIISMFFTACGGDTPHTPIPTPTPTPPSITLSITISTVTAYVGEPKTIPVTAQNTDFTVSVDKSGSGCDKSGGNIVCKPTASGTYTVTVTATADTQRKVSTTVTVPELEIIAGDGQMLYADDTESATITFYASGNWTATASDGGGNVPDWLSLDVVHGLAADESTLELFDDDSLFQSYDGDEYGEEEEIGITAVNINGNADIIVTLQPNDDDHAMLSTDDFKQELYDADSLLQFYDTSHIEDYDEAEVSINAVSVSGSAGNNAITVTLQPNDSMANRTATITIATSGGQINITITQRYIKRDGTPLYPPPPEVSIYLSPTSANILLGETITFTVTTQNTDFTVSDMIPGLIPEHKSATATRYPNAGCVKSGTDAVVCKPTAEGQQSFIVRATADTTKYAIATFTVTPEAPVWTLSQSSITFPSATTGYGAQTCQSVTISNTGNVALTGISRSISIGSTNFETCDSSPSSSIPTGGSSSVGVRPRTGLSAGTHSGTLTVSTTNGGSKTVSLSFTVNTIVWTLSQSSITFPPATAGYAAQTCQSVTISNTGTLALTGVSASITSGSANYETCGSSPSSSISAGNTSTVGVRPLPGRSAGTYTGTLTVSTTNGSSKTVSLSFTVNPEPVMEFTLSPPSIEFPSASIGYAARPTQSVTIRNTGNVAITGVSANITSGSSSFQITASPSTSISAGGTSTVSIRPTTGLSVGTYSGTLTVSTANAGSKTVSLSFTVTVVPVWTLSPTSIEFPSASIGYGAQTCQYATISNTGTVALTGVSASITNGSTNFETCASPLSTIPAGGTSNVGVRPRTGRPVGTYSGTLTVSSTNGGNKTVSLSSFTVTPDYEIRNADQLSNIRNNLSGNFKLMADISLTSIANWEPIGTSAAPFTGTINGNGYKITGLKISRNTEDYVGLFGYIRNGAAIDLVMENVDIQGRSYVGSVAGYMQYGTINGGSSTGLITSYVNSSYRNPYYSGGITGYMEGGTITGASSAVVVTSSVTSSSYYSDKYYTGGIAGYVNGGTITGSRSTGNVSSVIPYPAYSGGIAGYVANGGKIRDSSSTGSVISNSSGDNAVSGGIAGYADGSEISGSSSTGNVTASAYYRAYSGGIVGYATNISLISDSFSTGNISSSFVPSAAPALSDNFYAISGGIAGYANGGEISGSSSTGNISSSAPTGGILTRSYAISGGIAGQATNVRINRCFSMSSARNISSSAGSGGYSPGNSAVYSGGIAGYVNTGRITDCYSVRDITSSSSDMYGDTYSGGIAGYTSGNITNCYSRGNVSSTNSSSYADVYSGGIAGYAQGAQINGCTAATSAITAKSGAGRIAGGINTGNSAAISDNFALDTMIASGSAPLNTGSSYHGVDKTATELRTRSTYESGLGWRFGANDSNPWKMPSGSGYPILYWQTE